MDREDPAFGAEEIGALFRTVLDRPEPAAPEALLTRVRRDGGRLRRRRRLLAGIGAVVAVGVLAGAGWAVGVRPAATTTAVPAGPSSPAASSAAATAPGTPAPATGGAPADEPYRGATVRYYRELNARPNQDLLAFLRAHLPADFARVTDGTEQMPPGQYDLTRTDGGQVVVVRDALSTPVDRDAPDAACEPRIHPGGTEDATRTDCTGRTLPDGSVVLVSHAPGTLRGRTAVLDVLTPDGRTCTLWFLRKVDGPDGTLPTVSLDHLLALAETPGLVAAVHDGWQEAPPQP
ncbi:hypothetical protein ACFRKE_23100 [Kitasatospora indigofera]|uniref:hypothetical protein n=1 Tax=Kitasatospora indigofera TaxID=67307 RepID=UPI00367D6D1B